VAHARDVGLRKQPRIEIAHAVKALPDVWPSGAGRLAGLAGEADTSTTKVFSLVIEVFCPHQKMRVCGSTPGIYCWRGDF
jgi:hypothetical protein